MAKSGTEWESALAEASVWITLEHDPKKRANALAQSIADWRSKSPLNAEAYDHAKAVMEGLKKRVGSWPN